MAASPAAMPGQQAQTADLGSTEPATQDEVLTFLAMNPVEDHAAQQFMSMDPKLQRMVINKGSLAGSRSNTGAFIARMANIAQTVTDVEPATPQQVQQFLQQNPGVEDHATQQLMSMDPKLQKMVINRGSLAGSRNSTASLIGRMSSIRRTGQGVISNTPAQAMKPGTLSAFNDGRGFGFIKPDDNSEDVFFHIAAVSNGSNPDMIPGARLRFSSGLNERTGKTQAAKVVLDAPGVMNGGTNPMAGGMNPMAAAMAEMLGWMGWSEW